MMTSRCLSAFFACILLVNTTLRAAVPQIISYQGRVSVEATNFDGTGQYRFALVDAAGTTTYWSNDGTSIGGSQPAAAVTLAVTKGLYSVLLGDTALANMTAIPSSVFTNSDVHLRVWFDDGTNGSQLLSPDQRIGAVGYAMVAGTVDSGADITAGTVTATSFVGSGAELTNIRASAITPAPPGMVLIPAGSFMMGDGLDGLPNATPTVSTTVSAFYMDVNEVSLSKWQSVYLWATSNGDTFAHSGSAKAANHPVQTLDWYGVVKWCNARSEQDGKVPVYYTDDAQTVVYRAGNVDVTNPQVKWSANGYRLPTEAEWEKAARGGRVGLRFPWGNDITQNVANYFGSSVIAAYDLGPNGLNPIGIVGGTSPATSPAGSFAFNGYGLNDMAGNVSEWCWDRFGTPYAGGADPRGPDSGNERVLRGGGWSNTAPVLRCANRINAGATSATSLFGFRCVTGL